MKRDRAAPSGWASRRPTDTRLRATCSVPASTLLPLLAGSEKVSQSTWPYSASASAPPISTSRSRLPEPAVRDRELRAHRQLPLQPVQTARRSPSAREPQQRALHLLLRAQEPDDHALPVRARHHEPAARGAAPTAPAVPARRARQAHGGRARARAKPEIFPGGRA